MNFYQSVGFLFFGTRLKRLGEIFLSDVNRIYRQHNIPFDASLFPVFYILSKEGEVSIRHIAEQLHISHSAASQMVSGLKLKGFLKSTVSKKDARHKSVTFTVKGEKLLQKVLPVWDALQEAMEETAAASKESRKILNALTALEQTLQTAGVYELRIPIWD